MTELENILRSERLLLARTKDKISESGKNGYFIIQAQVANYLKNKEMEQKESVAANKKEFVLKMLPVVDSFRDAPVIAPANTEREAKMHESFGALLKGVLDVFNKYGTHSLTHSLIHSLTHSLTQDIKNMLLKMVVNSTIICIRQGKWRSITIWMREPSWPM